MIIPVRCMTCGKMLADKWRKYQAWTAEVSGDEESYTPDKALDKLGMARYCCRRHFLAQVDLIEKI